jgi:sulfite reductase (NADPH) flavoprotein alpha-component
MLDVNSTVPLIPDNAPFSPEQRAWLNGFLAGLFSRVPQSGTADAAAAPLQPLTILFGSQTGTAEGLARRAAKEAGRRGFVATVADMAQINPARLAAEKNLLVITSTYGDGDPPDNARILHAALGEAGAAPLPGLNFSVCALGDTNYPQFCQCGRDFDARLEKLGARRAAPRAECELDYEKTFMAWLETSLQALAGAPPAHAPEAPGDSLPAPPAVGLPPGAHSRQNPFPAPVVAVRRLSGRESAKEVNHVEFSLEGSGLDYEAGDALGVVPQNSAELIAEVLGAIGRDGEEEVPATDGSATSLRLALTHLYCLGRPSADLLALLGLGRAVAAGGSTASASAADFPQILDVLDALRAAPAAHPSPAAFVGALRKLQPRLYSIASSPKAHPGRVHLTVGAVRYETNGRRRRGICSTFLAEQALAAGKVGVFIHPNQAFRPPAGDDTPMIMVGPGTGIAPFRAFLQERRAGGAAGKNWLFFGDQRAATDFLYEDEIAAMRREGWLTRLDTAFSRDQGEKIYVQHRMIEQAAELFAWLEEGAHFYVCGDASRMARDVEAALHQVVKKAGGKTSEQAAGYVQNLRATKRYARDVY